MLSERLAYEADVRAIAEWSADALAAGRSIEAVARAAVEKRNDRKRHYRENMDPAVRALLERRNVVKYGDPVGPGPDWLLQRYGNWPAVLAAASRPAPLAGG